MQVTPTVQKILRQTAIEYDRAVTTTKKTCQNLDSDGFPCDKCVFAELKILRSARPAKLEQ
jgi:hypothetical protein